MFLVTLLPRACLERTGQKRGRELLILCDTCFAVCGVTPGTSVARGLCSGGKNNIGAYLQPILWFCGVGPGDL